jgi:SPP1 family predicted phage head-tail adaptor
MSEAQGSNGEITQSWVLLATKRASIEPITGREYWDGNQTLADQSFILKTSYDTTSATITPKGRILFGSREFDIITKVNPSELNEELHFMCKEKL